jgi:predicted XRE-type DNA-binding protein
LSADLKLPQADDLLAKAELAAKIIAEIQRRRMTQAQAAAALGIDPPKISAPKQGKPASFFYRAPDALSASPRTGH